MIRSFWRDGLVYTIGTVVTRGLGLLLLPLYTHTLTPDAFGLLDLIVTAGVLFNLLVPLETPQAVARLWNERPEGLPRRRLAGTGLLFAALAYGVFVALAWAAAPVLATLLSGRADDAAAVRAGAAFIAANGLLLVAQGQFRWALRPRAFALSGVGYSLAVLGGLALLIALGTPGVASVLWVQALAASLVAAACLWNLRPAFEWRVDRAELAELLRFSAPLVPAGLAVFATLHLHRFVLNAYAPLEAVGHFGLASRLASVATLVLVGVQGALTPLVYAHHAEPETPARLARLFELFWGAALLACLALALFAPEVIALLAAPAYADAAVLVVWLAPAALLAQMYVFAPGIPLAKKTHWQLGLTLASAALGLGLSFALVPTWQATGAAVAACAAAAAFFGSWVWLGQRLYPLPLRWLPLALATASAIGLASAGATLGHWPAGPATWLAKTALVATLLLVLLGTGVLQAGTLVRRLRRSGGGG